MDYIEVTNSSMLEVQVTMAYVALLAITMVGKMKNAFEPFHCNDIFGIGKTT